MGSLDTNMVVGSVNQSGQAKAVLNAPLINKNKSHNKLGKNQFSFEKSLTPYSIKYALADMLLKQGNTIARTALLSGLCQATVQKVKRGGIKLADEWVSQIKNQESNKHTFLSNIILDSINQNDLDKASLQQKVTSSSILIDKRRLLDGESTSNINHLASLDNLTNMASDINKTLDKLNAIDTEPISSLPTPES